MARNQPKAPARASAKKPASKKGPPRDNIDLLESVPLTLTAELGRARETIETVQEWGYQSLVELDKTVGDPVDIFLNGQLFARGEVVSVGENFGVRVVEVVESVD